MMNRLRNSDSPASTWFGGVDCRPSALRVSDSTTKILVKLVIISSSDGATDSTVMASMMVMRAARLAVGPRHADRERAVVRAVARPARAVRAVRAGRPSVELPVSAVPLEGAAGPVGLVGPDGEPASAWLACVLWVERVDWAIGPAPRTTAQR